MKLNYYTMKKLLFLFALMSISLFSNCSSNSDDDPDSTNEDPDVFIEYTVNGVFTSYLEAEIVVVSSSGEIDITATKRESGATVERMLIRMTDNPSVGTHQIDGIGPDRDYQISYQSDSTTGINNPTGTTGTFIISSIQGGYIEGTFSFTGGHVGTPPVNVTGGRFRVLIN